MRPIFSRPTPMADSRFIESMRYAHNTRTLELTIRGTRYRYYGVGERKATRLAAAASAGAYYNAQIKGRHPRRKFRPDITPAAAEWNRQNGVKRAPQIRLEAPLSPTWACYGVPTEGGTYHYGYVYGFPTDAIPSLIELASGAVVTTNDLLGNTPAV